MEARTQVGATRTEYTVDERTTRGQVPGHDKVRDRAEGRHGNVKKVEEETEGWEDRKKHWWMD